MKRHFQILKSFQSFVRPKTIAGRLPKKEADKEKTIISGTSFAGSCNSYVSFFSALLDNVIILMNGIHRNIMKNDMIVQWKIKLFETQWFQSTEQHISFLVVCWNQQSSFASRNRHYYQNLMSFCLYLDLPTGESSQATCLQNHRTSGWLKLAGISGSYPQFQQGPPKQGVHNHVLAPLGDPLGGDLTASGQPVSVLPHLLSTAVPLFFRSNFLCFSLYPLPLVLSLWTTEKRLALSSLWLPFRYWYALMRDTLTFPFSILNNPNSLSLPL